MPETKAKIMRNFYGIDGDKIGRVVEAHLIKNEVNALTQFSANVTSALKKIRNKIVQDGGTVIFCAGDSVLFQGSFDDSWCTKILDLFLKTTGCTASMGVGDTLTESYLALKLAKANGGGEFIHYAQMTERNHG
ncbi:MAG: hypothetical protein C5S48_03940 [Candidatus Methanogaster sp.]|nr:MAG: hypothetical protein C5S48_03940 [ANME-2 cluster archaeon]